MSYHIIHEAVKEVQRYRFMREGHICTRCSTKLETAYCEGALYAVRCPTCETITFVRARNPIDAESTVGKKEDL